ncbi:multisubunit sodium/proton antiporter MrpE subunit [Natranaerovirga pectinivora]|uniref:Multisubunit sodium/proton antiporter MrpE subunit n=1 Tax=Natranaerovirga pectinivora TaxID=682400 RepID=A0A4R3MQL3_9FIRM|nr:Na+/H+ antiporter subunit E [Natranaerovirga pectinivora]TCT15461.1 multisubunit sodium/proton antiporter MrpE subunit [Natranaerovirga pectinivora]
MKLIVFTCVLLFFWVGLTQSLSIVDLLIGLLISVLSIILSRKYFSADIVYPKFRFIKIIKYILVLIPQIIISGFKSLYILITFKTDVKIVKVPTNLSNDFKIFVLAVSITLTPGTITVHKQDNILYVLRLFPQHVDEEKEAESIKDPFEKMLLED